LRTREKLFNKGIMCECLKQFGKVPFLIDILNIFSKYGKSVGRLDLINSAGIGSPSEVVVFDLRTTADISVSVISENLFNVEFIFDVKSE
jgi:hypothetical protein